MRKVEISILRHHALKPLENVFFIGTADITGFNFDLETMRGGGTA